MTVMMIVMVITPTQLVATLSLFGKVNPHSEELQLAASLLESLLKQTN